MKELSVSIQFSNDYVFTRKLLPLTENFKINEKAIQKSFYYNLLKYYFMDNSILIPQGKINQLINTDDKLRDQLLRFSRSKNNIDELKELIHIILDKFDSINDFRSSLFRDLEAINEDQLVKNKISTIKDEIKLIHTVIQVKKIDSLKQRIKSKKEIYELIKRELNEQIQDQVNKEKELNQLRQIVEEEDVQNGLSYEDIFKELITKKVQLALENEECYQQLNAKEDEKSRLIEQINLVKDEIKSKQASLNQQKPKLDELKEKVRSLFKEVQWKKLEIDQLFLHDNHSKNVQQNEIEKQIEEMQSELTKLENHANEITGKRDELSKLVEKLHKDQIEVNETIEKKNQEIVKLKGENLRNETLKRKLSAEMDKHKTSLNKYLDKKRIFYPLIGKTILKGKENLEKVIELFKNGTDEEKQLANSYYGWFIDNISFDKTFSISIERTSITYLYKHMVKNTNTANRLIKKFNEMKFDGTCEFVVLDLLKRKDIPVDNESSVSKEVN